MRDVPDDIEDRLEKLTLRQLDQVSRLAERLAEEQRREQRTEEKEERDKFSNIKLKNKSL